MPVIKNCSKITVLSENNIKNNNNKVTKLLNNKVTKFFSISNPGSFEHILLLIIHNYLYNKQL